MKKSKKIISLVLAISMILAVAVSASAAGPLRAKPYDNIKVTVGTTEKSYPFDVDPKEPCVRVWVRNDSSEGNLNFVVKAANGSSKYSGSLGPGESTENPVEIDFLGSSAEQWKVVFSNGSTGSVKSVSGTFAVRTGSSWASMTL